MTIAMVTILSLYTSTTFIDQLGKTLFILEYVISNYLFRKVASPDRECFH